MRLKKIYETKGTHMRWEEWSERIWPVLIGAANHRETIDYSTLKSLIGFGGQPNWLSDSLGRIASYCHRNGWPILPVLVINQTGAPGNGIPFVQDHLLEREKVFAFEWYRQRPVGLNDFLEPACLSGRSTSSGTTLEERGWPPGYFENTFGSIDDETFVRQPQGELPKPVSFD